MAMNVKFLKGVKKSLPTTRDSNTLYFVTDEGALYLGATLIGANFTSAIEAANAAIKAINDHGYVNSTEVGTAIGTALESYYTKTQIDNKIGTLKIGDTNYDSVVDYVVAKTTGIATDAVVAEKADKIAPVKPNNIAVLATDGNLSDGGKTIEEVLQTAMTNTMNQIGALNMEKSSAAVEAGKGIQVTVKEAAGKLTEVSVSGNYDNKYDALGAAGDALDDAKDYTDAEITGLEFALSEDGKTLELKNKAGTAVATLDTTDFVVDGMLSSVVADQTNNKLTFTWNTDSGIKETVIELSSIADIYTGSTNASEVNVTVSNTNVISATVGANVKADIAKGVDAQGRVATLEGKVDVAKVSTAISAATTDMATNASVDNKLKNYTKTADLGDLATKNEASLNLGQYAKSADLGTAAAKNVEFFATSAQGSTADSALQEVTIAGTKLTKTNSTVSAITLSAALNLTGGADSFDARIGEAKGIAEAAQSAANNVGSNLSYNYKTWTDTQTAIQGATTNTVKDCVDAINTMNGQVGSTIGTVENIVSQLTWGSF